MKFKVGQRVYWKNAAAYYAITEIDEEVVTLNDGAGVEVLTSEIALRGPSKFNALRATKSLNQHNVRGQHLGTTSEGVERYEVNQQALDLNIPSTVVREAKEKPFVRVTLQKATPAQTRDALHGILRKKNLV